MARDDGQERTEQPSPKRLREAREKGQVARSRELNTMVLMLVAAGGLLVLGQGILTQLAGLVQARFVLDRSALFDPKALVPALTETILAALHILAPFLLLLVLAAALGGLLVGGWSFSPQAFGFKWEKLDPIKGMGRVFSLRGLMELVKALAKFLLVGGVAVLLLNHFAGELMGLDSEPLVPALAHAAHLYGWMFLGLAATLVLIAAVDVPFQIWEHGRQLRMTRQELKDEHKETEGHPEVKGRVRSMQRQMARRRMMAEVPKADVVVTNPTHYAVALRYDPKTMAAPRVVAKGADLVAAEIRRLAREHGVTLVEAPPLARALYASTKLDQEVPAGLYVAVAHILAYVFQLRSHRGTRQEPAPPSDLPIPDEFLNPAPPAPDPDE